MEMIEAEKMLLALMKKGYKETEIAEKINVHQSTVSRWLAKKKNIKATSFFALYQLYVQEAC